MDRSLEKQGFSEKKWICICISLYLYSDLYLSTHFYFERNSRMVMKFLDRFSVDI